MIEQDIASLLTPKELEKALALDTQMVAMMKELTEALEKTRKLPQEYKKLQAAQRNVLARAYEQQETDRAQCSARGECHRKINNPQATDGNRLACSSACQFLNHEIVGWEWEEDWTGTDYHMPVWGYLCRREERLKKT